MRCLRTTGETEGRLCILWRGCKQTSGPWFCRDYTLCQLTLEVFAFLRLQGIIIAPSALLNLPGEGRGGAGLPQAAGHHYPPSAPLNLPTM